MIHKMVDFILQNLSKSERNEFMMEMLSWEATAEINSLPDIKQKILDRSKKLNKKLNS
jgi:hypothetical protein